MNHFMHICLNCAPVETLWRYLAHIIPNDLNDNNDIRRQLKCFMEGLTCCYVPSELVHIQRNCFCLCHIVEVCTPQAFGVYIYIHIYIKYEMEVAYDNVFRRFIVYDRFANASKMFAEKRVDNFENRMRRLIYGFREGLNAPKKQSNYLLSE